MEYTLLKLRDGEFELKTPEIKVILRFLEQDICKKYSESIPEDYETCSDLSKVYHLLYTPRGAGFIFYMDDLKTMTEAQWRYLYE